MSGFTIVDAIRARAAAAPEAPALIAAQPAGAAPAHTSYGALLARAAAIAAALRDRGVSPAWRVGLVARQGRGFIELALGILSAHACMVPIPEETTGAAFDELVARTRLHALLRETSEGFALEVLPAPRPVDENDDRDFRALAPAYLRFTSGTTSRRKGVVLGHDAILARTEAANRALAIGPADRVLWLLPMAHHFVVSILLYLRYGAGILLPNGPLAKPILELAAREGASVLYASPYHVNLLASDASGIGLPTLRLAISTAEGLRREVAEAFRVRFGRPVSQALGIIEMGLPLVNLVAAEAKPTALGRPLPGFRVLLRGEHGEPVTDSSAERTGEICIRGPGAFGAYLDPWTPAARVLEPDGFRTGDQGYFDADGDLFLVGRRASRINMAGMKFFAEEVEAVLDAHPLVKRSRVSSRVHAHLGEIPVAELEAADPEKPPTRAELAAHCKAHLPAYKIPREFKLVAALPETATGKLARA
jgi:long-chain acyl-CoA synthetase